MCLKDKSICDQDIYYPSYVATDFYNHYKEDIELMADMDQVF